MSSLLLLACGQEPDGDDDIGDGADAATPDLDAGSDADSPTTEVSGTWDGSTFSMTHTVVIFADPLSTLCLSNRPISAPNCGYDDPEPKIVLRGKFAVDASGADWAIPQVEIRRLGGAAAVELIDTGTLTISMQDPAAGIIAGTLSVTFDGGEAQGSFSAP